MAFAAYLDAVQKIYIAFYQRPADPAGLRYWAQRMDAAGGDQAAVIDAFATSPEAVALYGPIDASTIGTVVDAIYLALYNRAPDAGGKKFYVDGFNAGTFTPGTIALNILNGASNDDAVAIANKLVVANQFTQQVDGRALTNPDFGIGSSFNVTYAGDADAVAARDILKAVTSSPSTVLNAAQVTTVLKDKIADPTDPIQGQTGGQTFDLKIGEDRLTGGDGNDTFNAAAVEQKGAGGSADTLEGFDILDGGKGIDTLNATINAGATVAPSLSNIENVIMRVTTAAGAIDFAASTGVQSVTVQNSTANTGKIDNLGAVATLAVKNQNFNATFDKSTAATLALTLDTFGKAAAANNVVELGATKQASATTLNITANNANATVQDTAGGLAATVTIAATGANRLNLADAAVAKNVTITGAGSVDLIGSAATTLGTAFTGALATFNASAAEGAIKADIRSTVLATVTTGKGADWIDMDTAVVAGTTVNLGAGNDTLLTGALLGNFAKVDGGDGDADTINITNGAVLTAANAKLISNFEVLDVSGGTGNYDVSLNNFATVQIDEAVNGALAAGVDFKNAADNFTLTVASKAATKADFAVANTIAVTGKDYTGTTALGTAETFTLVANMRDGSKDDAANGNINANVITVAGVEHLVVDAGVSTLDGGSKALNAAQHTLTAKFVATEAETVTIKGAASVDLSGATTIGVVTKVDATGSTGNVTINLSTHAKSVAYFGSEGVDTLTTGTKGDNIYTGKGADIVTLTTAGVRDTFVLKAATDSQIGDTDKSGKITIAGDEVNAAAPAGFQQTIDTITGFTAGGTAVSDRLDVTNFAFSGAQRGVVDANTLVGVNTDLTSIADLFAAPAGDRGIAFSNAGGADLYVFVDANKDGNFTAADDLVIKLMGLGAAGLSEVDVNF